MRYICGGVKERKMSKVWEGNNSTIVIVMKNKEVKRQVQWFPISRATGPFARATKLTAELLNMLEQAYVD